MSPPIPALLLYAVFFLSGIAAILYQLVWQRSLLTLLGTDAESVTLVVAAFLLGLGLGALGGGALARTRRSALVFFAAAELGIAAFGCASLPFFRWLASFTAGATGLAVGLVAFAAVLVPTLLMGATLPLLVGYLVGRSGNVGRSVGVLYFANTLGSAVGCAAAAALLFRALGQSGAVLFAAGLNVFVALAVTATLLARRARA